jgi:hypothetical protein
VEDAFTRQHAQYLVAAVLAVGARVVGRTTERLRLRPMFVDLHALGVTPSHVTAQALQHAARRAVRTSLREEPHAVQLTPIEGGYRVRVLLGPQRVPLQPYELTDLQVAWERAQQRELGRSRALPSPHEVATRQAEVNAALGQLRETHKRLVAGEPALQAELADAMNRAQLATDALRAAVQRANPLQPQRRTYADTLTFTVKAAGLDALPLVERDRAMRDAFARAAGLSDPGELRVTTRPTRREGESLVRVDFNLRHDHARGPEHLNPESLRDAILSRVATLPSAPGGAVAMIQGIECPRRSPAPDAGPSLDPLPAALQAVRLATPER